MNKKLILALIPLVLIAGCTRPGMIIYYSYNYDQIPMQPSEEFGNYNVQISFDKSTVCVGDMVTGRIDSNIENGFCRIFYNPGTGYKVDSNVLLDANGDYTETRTPNTVGYADFYATCCDANLNCKRSNIIGITVEACPTQNWKCCMLGKTNFQCYQNICPSGFTPVKSYGSLSSCQADCRPPSIPSCTDSDGGNDIYVKGTCQDAGSITDDCATQTYVNENWCENGVCIGASMLCPTGYHCWDGACVPMQQVCSGIIRPTSQSSCDAGVCDIGSCVYHPATVYSISYCRCE